MGTMQFSIPDDVKAAFDELFKDENKNAVVTHLLQRAIEEERRRRAAEPGQNADAASRVDEAIRQLRVDRARGPSYTTDEIIAMIHEGRP